MLWLHILVFLFLVMRQPFEFDPAERVRHKFMIQTVKLEPGMTLENVVSCFFLPRVWEVRLKLGFRMKLLRCHCMICNSFAP